MIVWKFGFLRLCVVLLYRLVLFWICVWKIRII